MGNSSPHIDVENDDSSQGSVAGETLRDPRRWLSHGLFAFALLALAATLTALAVGHTTQAILGAVVAVVAMSAGVTWLYVHRQRIRSGLDAAVAERPEDTHD